MFWKKALTFSGKPFNISNNTVIDLILIKRGGGKRPFEASAAGYSNTVPIPTDNGLIDKKSARYRTNYSSYHMDRKSFS